MGSISGEGSGVKAKAIFAETAERVRKELAKRIGEEVGKAIEGEIDQMLGREAYERREGVGPWVEIKGECQRCKSRQSRQFSRNGRRGRRLMTQWDEVEVNQQRLVCE